MKKSMLLSTIAMIVVVVVALSTATFAWFSASSQTAIEGTMTIQTGREFMLKVANASGDAWEMATNKIDIATDMYGISPVSPTHALHNTDYPYTTNPGNADAIPAAGAGKWYTVAGQSGAYSNLANKSLADADKVFAVTSFQVGVGDGLAQNVKLQTTIKTTAGADKLQALKGVRVVYQVTSFNDAGTATATNWYGTSYTYGGTGLFDTDGTVKTQGNYESSTGTGTSVTTDEPNKVALKSITENGTYGTLTTYSTLAAGQAAKDIFVVAGSTEGKEDGLYRYMEDTLAFGAVEYKTITVYVWLDGHVVDDMSAQKSISVTVSFAKTA